MNNMRTFDTAILSYGNFLDKESWKAIEVPIDNIKEIGSSADEPYKLEVRWIEGNEHFIDYFNSVSFK